MKGHYYVISRQIIYNVKRSSRNTLALRNRKVAQILFVVIRVSLKLLSAALRFLSHHTCILSNRIPLSLPPFPPPPSVRLLFRLLCLISDLSRRRSNRFAMPGNNVVDAGDSEERRPNRIFPRKPDI